MEGLLSFEEVRLLVCHSAYIKRRGYRSSDLIRRSQISSLINFTCYKMSDPKNVKFPLKVVLNKQKTKVLYAEANSDFTDVLLSFLTLPLGTIVRLLNKHHSNAPAFGSLTTLYNCLSNLDNVHFQTERCKEKLLNPRTSAEAACHKLKLNVDDTDRPTRYFRCADWKCDFKKFPYVSMYYGIPWIKCHCGKASLLREIGLRDPTAQYGNAGVFTMRTAHFIITDDLQLLPSVTGDAIQFLSSLGITDSTGTELMDVTFGFKEIMDLLKGSLLSETPLTDIILNKKQVDSVTVKYETGTLVHPIEKIPTSAKKLIVKAILQKSTNKLLFIEADENFVEFLFSLLTIPLGRIEHLLGGSTTLKNIDNLYRSLGNINGVKYLKNQGTKSILLNPKLPHGYTSYSQFLPLVEEGSPVLFFHEGSQSEQEYLSVSYSSVSVNIRFPKGQGNYVKGPTMYMVTDDLIVTPLFTTSSLSILNRLKIPYSDVKELELNIGMEEALSIVRASLTSTCALTIGLIDPSLLNKQPKQEY